MKALPVLCGILCVAAAPATEFEVVSIRPNSGNGQGSGARRFQESWRANNISVKAIIVSAFQVLELDIAGAPSWIDSERFDIEAKFENDPAYTTPEGLNRHRLRLQALLASRFQLQIHRERKEMPSYVLVTAKSRLKLTPSEKKDASSMRKVNGHWECKGVDLEGLAQSLTAQLGRHVVNQTGIEGRFDFALDFEPEETASGDDIAKPVPGAYAPKASLFAAIQDQLGLKLESRRATVELLMVDRVERPSEN